LNEKTDRHEKGRTEVLKASLEELFGQSLIEVHEGLKQLECELLLLIKKVGKPSLRVERGA
jgi:hypothetical protein